MQAFCICRAPVFLCRGGVMECMVCLVRLRVGGNFFHTLGQFSFLHGFAKTTSFASSMHWSGSSALYQCSPSYEISEILKNIFATFFHQLPIPFFVLPNIRFHLEPNRFAVFAKLPNNNFHCHRGAGFSVRPRHFLHIVRLDSQEPSSFPARLVPKASSSMCIALDVCVPSGRSGRPLLRQMRRTCNPFVQRQLCEGVHLLRRFHRMPR